MSGGLFVSLLFLSSLYDDPCMCETCIQEVRDLATRAGRAASSTDEDACHWGVARDQGAWCQSALVLRRALMQQLMQ